MQSIIRIDAVRFNKKTKRETREIRYYISSLEADKPEKLIGYIRNHWSIENTLHWSLDMTFRDDASRVRKDHGPLNLLTIRKMAFNIMKMDQSNMSIKKKRIKAALDHNYRLSLISKSFVSNLTPTVYKK